MTTQDTTATDNEVPCPCCLNTGEVLGPDDKRTCPLCDGWRTVPKEVAGRFLEVAARRLPKGEGA